VWIFAVMPDADRAPRVEDEHHSTLKETLKMASAVLPGTRGPSRWVLARLFPAPLLILLTLAVPAAARAQGPSLSAKEIRATGDEMGSFYGVSATLRPPSRGVALSLDWAKHGGLRLLSGSVGYSLPLVRAGANAVFVRPAVGAAEVSRKALPKRLLALSVDLEVSRPLFGLQGWRALLGVSGSADISLKKRRCQGCARPSYEDGFRSVGVYLGIMWEVR
jgi:hypothetical protein